MDYALTAEQVFVTDGFPSLTYVSFDEGRREHDLEEGLAQQNKIISIVGPSKSGKSTLCNKIFGPTRGVDKIYVTGDSLSSADNLWQEAYRQVTDDTDKSFFEIGHAERIERIAGTDLPLIIDDFHYIPKNVQPTICRQLKNAASEGLRIIVLSTPHRGDDPIRGNPDLSGRYFAVNFRFWDDKDLSQIGTIGFSKLGLRLSDVILQQLAGHALRSPQLMQTLCLETCRSLGQDRPYEQAQDKDVNMDEVARRTLRSYNLETPFHILSHGPPERGSKRLDYKLITGGTADVYQILVQLLQSDPQFYQISLDDLKTRMKSIVSDSREPNIRAALQQLNALYRDTVDPIEWDDEKRQLTIVDPHFYFYLRNKPLLTPRVVEPQMKLL
jgi:hypothetical protein